MPNPLINFLKLFRDIPADDEGLIAGAMEHRTYKEGDYLFKAGKICRELFFVCEGILRIKVINENGNEVTHFFIRENKFCSILNSFNNQVVAQESIQAACNAEVLAISRTGLDTLYSRLSYLKPLITEITHQALLDKIAVRNAYLGQDSTTRYRMFLMRQPEIAYRVPLSDIASYLGITPQSLSRIRKNIR
ncbi:MAG: Crp/Fnr family transcriptional regulator [Puia sp.]|nr:Crp/Fnr family transcriptional regulator [Puia sp.]